LSADAEWESTVGAEFGGDGYTVVVAVLLRPCGSVAVTVTVYVPPDE
jgi:hypothetical protein